MATLELANGRRMDARPDRIDLRDRVYQPPLVSLPEQWPARNRIDEYFPDYADDEMVLDQGKEGACTGFGLAAVINYLYWTQSLDEGSEIEKVSARMLYQMARFYDEWDGEDYEGSSCRGAMKGWHKHGVCRETIWPYVIRRGKVVYEPPQDRWSIDAAQRPLGAYYRINKDSITDMQAAIHEVGAIYVSALVHNGWMLESANELPKIDLVKTPEDEMGGHAFALVGYDARGFIVQNSWGSAWGYHGFAVMTYDDWLDHGTDAWVAVLGAPREKIESPPVRTAKALQDIAGEEPSTWRLLTKESKPYAYEEPKLAPVSRAEAYRRTLVLGNNGSPVNRLVDLPDGESAVKRICFDQPLKSLKTHTQLDVDPVLAVYAHGGLNDEEASLNRVSVLSPYFVHNDVYPLFITWRTGFLESIGGILSDAVFGKDPQPGAKGFLDDVLKAISEARDRLIEVSCQAVIKPIWTQMKQNAEAAARTHGGLRLLAGYLAELKQEIPNLKIHFVGHSAGSIVLGHLLDQCARRDLNIATCALFAPACSVEFANHFYLRRGIGTGTLKAKELYLEILDDEREKADSVSVYGKSLLYLVSRALEIEHKTPLLGMELAADKRQPFNSSIWSHDGAKEVRRWRRNWRGRQSQIKPHGRNRAEVSVGIGTETIPLAHGSFDNDVEVMTRTIERIRGAGLKYALENLNGY